MGMDYHTRECGTLLLLLCLAVLALHHLRAGAENRGKHMDDYLAKSSIPRLGNVPDDRL
jgi:hypothetical protein